MVIITISKCKTAEIKYKLWGGWKNLGGKQQFRSNTDERYLALDNALAQITEPPP